MNNLPLIIILLKNNYVNALIGAIVVDILMSMI